MPITAVQPLPHSPLPKRKPTKTREAIRAETGIAPKFWRVSELVAMGIGGRTTVNKLLKNGALRKIKIGKTTLVSDAEVQRLLQGG
jgi:hypothetical protein